MAVKENTKVSYDEQLADFSLDSNDRFEEFRDKGKRSPGAVADLRPGLHAFWFSLSDRKGASAHSLRDRLRRKGFVPITDPRLPAHPDGLEEFVPEVTDAEIWVIPLSIYAKLRTVRRQQVTKALDPGKFRKKERREENDDALVERILTKPSLLKKLTNAAKGILTDS